MSIIKTKVFLGNRDHYTELLKSIADMAQPEKWSYGRYKHSEPYKILQNYFEHTFDRLYEENKLIYSTDGVYMCMNTGLLTSYNQEIYAIFIKNNRSKGLPWFFQRVCKDTDSFFQNNFTQKPLLADYFYDVKELIYDKNLEIIYNVNHIVDDNYERFANVGYVDKQLIIALLSYSKDVLIAKLTRNFKLALPFYYHNTNTNERKIQLLVPLYFPGGACAFSIRIG